MARPSNNIKKTSKRSPFVKCTYLVTTVRYHRDALLCDRHMFDMGEVLSSRLLNAGQQQETIAVRSEHRMRQNVEPFILRCAFGVRLKCCVHFIYIYMYVCILWNQDVWAFYMYICASEFSLKVCNPQIYSAIAWWWWFDDRSVDRGKGGEGRVLSV